MYINLEKYKLPNFRQKQINHATFKNLVNSIDEITTLPEEIKEKIKEDIVFPSIKEKNTLSEKDTIKTSFETEDKKVFEAVLLKHENDRNTICVSSQVGCPIGGKFCATGKMGFERNLNYQEIIDQVLHFARKLKEEDKKITNIVFMGMGEPFLNLENLEKSTDILTNPEEFNLSQRRLTVSTIWTGKEVLEFFKKKTQINLAISLHSAIQEKREQLIPIAKKMPLRQIVEDLYEYFEFSNRRITLEYTLLNGVNDQKEDLKALQEFVLKDLGNYKKLIHINLIPYNMIDNTFHPTKEKEIKNFKRKLENKGIKTTTRKSLGQDTKSACGMLQG